jgi:hypothetical protein
MVRVLRAAVALMPVRASVVKVYPTTMGGDTTKPGTCVLAYVSQTGGGLVTLKTDHTPGDNAFAGADAYAYRMAYASTAYDGTEAWWNAASTFEPVWTENTAVANAAQTFPAVEFPLPGTYHVAIRFRDTVGNVGGISNSVAVTV